MQHTALLLIHTRQKKLLARWRPSQWCGIVVGPSVRSFVRPSVGHGDEEESTEGPKHISSVCVGVGLRPYPHAATDIISL